MNDAARQADDIRREMRQVRSDLGEDVKDIVSQARTLTDWRTYTRTHPWVCLGCAAAIGYLAVPSGHRVLKLDESGVKELARQQKLVVRMEGQDRPQRGLLGLVAGMAMKSLLNGGLGILTQQLDRIATGAFQAAAANRREHD